MNDEMMTEIEVILWYMRNWHVRWRVTGEMMRGCDRWDDERMTRGREEAIIYITNGCERKRQKTYTVQNTLFIYDGKWYSTCIFRLEKDKSWFIRKSELARKKCVLLYVDFDEKGKKTWTWMMRWLLEKNVPSHYYQTQKG